MRTQAMSHATPVVPHYRSHSDTSWERHVSWSTNGRQVKRLKSIFPVILIFAVCRQQPGIACLGRPRDYADVAVGWAVEGLCRCGFCPRRWCGRRHSFMARLAISDRRRLVLRQEVRRCREAKESWDGSVSVEPRTAHRALAQARSHRRVLTPHTSRRRHETCASLDVLKERNRPL